MSESGWKYRMEVTKTVRCMLIGLTRRESFSGDNFQHWKQERIEVYIHKMRSGQESEEDEGCSDRE